MKASTILLVSILTMVLFNLPTPTSGTVEKNGAFNAQYKLYSRDLVVSIQPSLYMHYSNISHKVAYDRDYARFVTPKAVQPIADSILKIIDNMSYKDEQFANAALSMVHQIPYNITGAKYPVETLVNNYGDCGGLSLLAASIMKAGGLDVILIKYTGTDASHLNVGVYLPYTPLFHSLLMTPTCFEYNNKTYWTAEATPQGDWKVGDQSYTFANAQTTIIPLETVEESSPGQVACAHTPLSPSAITINLSAQPASNQNDNRGLVISGSIQPALSQNPITLYVKNGSYTNYLETLTDDAGNYAFTWNFTSSGKYYLTTAWSGNGTEAGADSETLAVFVGPESLLQFQSDDYNYIIGVGIGDVAVRRVLGVGDFLNLPLGTNVSLSYKFMVLPTGHTASVIETKNITIPAREQTLRMRNRQTRVIQIPARTITVPANIPRGMEALRLSDSFEENINNKFCFTVQNDLSGNYSLGVKGLNDVQVTNMKLEKENGTVFLNATESIMEGTWYSVKTAVSERGIATILQDEEGTPIKSISASYNSKSATPLVMLIANNIDGAVAVRDLKIQTIEEMPILPEEPRQPPDSAGWQFPYLYTLVLLAVTFAAAATYVIKVKKSRVSST